MCGFSHVICRTPGPDFAAGLTSSRLGKPDLAIMLEQHRAYVATLSSLGLTVEVLPPLPGFPDAYFVEDAAVVVAEVAIITRPGAVTRRGEAEVLAPVLARHRKIARIEPPGTLDGGDVLIIERQVLIGISERTNPAGAAQLGRILEPYGYAWTAIPVAAGLHFKSSVNWLGGDTLLLSQAFAERGELRAYRRLIADPEEEYACNTLWINGTLLTPRGFRKTRALLDLLGLPVVELEVSEARKMDGGLTCMSLRF